jgi:hypothetical protein
LSYGQVPTHRQGELIQSAASTKPRDDKLDDHALLEALTARLRGRAA